MLYPVEKLLNNRGAVRSVKQTDKVRVALAQMAQGDFSQLPVIDEQGYLVGLISEQTITRTYYHVDENVSLFDLTVDHCMAPAVTLNIDADIFEALDRLQRTYAIVITENRKPIGLLTFYDTTHFFRNLTEGLIFVEDIETSLRQTIEAVYDTDERRQQATLNTFGMDGAKPRNNYNRLTFGQYINLITHPKNWADFEPYLESSKLFRTLMDGVRDTRNQLAHFRGELEPLQFDQLRHARDWLSSRPKPKTAIAVKVNIPPAALPIQPAKVVNPGLPNALPPDQGKYTPLAHWLQHQKPAKAILVTFEQIESLLGEALPSSARDHRSWWANDATGHSHARSWLTTGWRVEDVDLAAGNVTFRHTHNALYQVFFTEIIQRLREVRPDVGHINTSTELNYCNFKAGRSGFTFGWNFPRHQGIRIELYIDTSDGPKNKAALQQLEVHKAAIEARVGAPLEWLPQPDHRGSRICITHPIDITAPPETLAPIKTWAVDTMLKFMDAFQPRLKELALD